MNTPKKFLKHELDLNVNEDPHIKVENIIIQKSIEKFKIKSSEMNVLLGIGGSGPSKRIPAKTFLNVIEKLLNVKKCRFFLAHLYLYL